MPAPPPGPVGSTSPVLGGLHGAEAVLKLRAVRANGDWDEYWRHHLAAERIQLVLKITDLVEGGVSHRGMHRSLLPLQARGTAGGLCSDQVVLSLSSALRRPHPTPCRLGATSRCAGYTHRLLLGWRSLHQGRRRPPEFPCLLCDHPVPPTPGSSSAPARPGLQRLRGLAVISAARHSLVPLRG